jgi:hypothetical protein
MRQQDGKQVITRERYDAVLLDLDGVITDTAKLHADCWKEMFDEYLQKRATRRGEAVRPFDLATDYRLYVVRESRFDGVRAFLVSRGMQLQRNPRRPARGQKRWAGWGTPQSCSMGCEDRGVERLRGKRSVHPSSSTARVQNRRSAEPNCEPY